MDLTRFWPWKQFALRDEEILRLKRELTLLRNIHKSKKDEMETAMHAKDEELGRLQLDLQVANDKLVEKDGHIRKLGTILAMKAGIAVIFLLLCMAASGQVLIRNVNAFDPNEFGLLAGTATVTLTNPAAIWTSNSSTIFPSTPALIISNNTGFVDGSADSMYSGQVTAAHLITNGFGLWTNSVLRTANGTALGTGVGYALVQHFQPATNIFSRYAGWYLIGGGVGGFGQSGDGNFIVSPDSDNGNILNISGYGQGLGPTNLDAVNWATNTGMADCVAFACLPGYAYFLTNTATVRSVLDNSMFIGGGSGLFRHLDEFSVSIGTIASPACLVSWQSFFLGGASGGDVQSSTNDVWLGVEGGNHNGTGWTSRENIIIGNNTLPNTSGFTNFVVGSGLDLPTNNVNGQINIMNLIYGSGGVTETTTVPAGGQININSHLLIAGTTNEIIFGSTNTAPVTTATPSKWISVQVSGENTAYRLPLYQ